MQMQEPSDETLLSVLTEIRIWIRAATYRPVRELLEEALPDTKSREAYQMFDGSVPISHVRKVCKMSPNAVVALTARCMAMGLMETNADNRRVRLFDLQHFGLMAIDHPKALGGEG